MATSGATLITALSLRLRDSSNTAHSRDLLKRILTHCQRAVNLAEKIKKKTAVAFVPSANRTLYRTSEIASDVGRLDRLVAGGRALPEIEWSQLVDNSRTWYRDVAMAHRAWARIGGNLVVLTPALAAPVALTAIYTTKPADVVDDATNVDLADEWVPLLMDLAETILLMRARIPAPMESLMARVGTAISIKQLPSAGKASL